MKYGDKVTFAHDIMKIGCKFMEGETVKKNGCLYMQLLLLFFGGRQSCSA